MWKRILAGALCAAIAASASHAAGKRGTEGPIPDGIWTKMQGVSWHANLPCPKREDLRLLRVPFIDFNGKTRTGQLIVDRKVAGEMLDIFADIHAAGFPIQSMKLVHQFRGDDGFSMAANNTSAFNCRVVAGSSRLSQHALGRAIDINPVQNPYVNGGRTSPSAGVDFDERKERKPQVKGVITAGDAVVTAFKKRGWGWGGDWSSLKDYQHFSQNGN
ncbi:M15 family metallopeptidase [Antarctobacter jejuensis]|uniref:M15 family metallopeptidase n=1 Tax=Antarctobacter jejuensis TaxID=1439938 RepID=UPI003FCF49FF